VNVGWVYLSLDDIENGDVTALLSGDCRDHAVFRLEQASHDVEDCCLADCLGLFNLVTSEGCIRCHQKVTSWCGNQRGENADEIVVHVARVPEGCGTCRHDG